MPRSSPRSSRLWPRRCAKACMKAGQTEKISKMTAAELWTTLQRRVWRRGYALGRDPGGRTMEDLAAQVEAEAAALVAEIQAALAAGFEDADESTI